MVEILGKSMSHCLFLPCCPGLKSQLEDHLAVFYLAYDTLIADTTYVLGHLATSQGQAWKLLITETLNISFSLSFICQTLNQLQSS